MYHIALYRDTDAERDKETGHRWTDVVLKTAKRTERNVYLPRKQKVL
jgi:hypothetical protein